MEPPVVSPFRKAVVSLAFFSLIAYTGYRGAGAGGSGSMGEAESPIRFAEVSKAVGVDFTHQGTTVDPKVGAIEAQITATGAAVSVCDFDADGKLDLYAVSSALGSKNALFRNLGEGRFEDVAERAGLADLNRPEMGCSNGSIWGDIDNDGFDDVFVYKWGQGQLLRNQGDGTFVDITQGSGLERWLNSHAANWFDYNRDGILDLFVGGYFAEEHNLWDLETSRIMQDSFEFSHNGGKNYMYRGVGDGTFVDVTEELGLKETRWTYASVAADFDQDGWQDLYVANDYGTEELYLNKEGRVFENAVDIGLDGESKSGMCATLGDIWDGERMAVYITNISKRGYLFQGNNLRVNLMDKYGQMLQVHEVAAADCGWAWGAQFGDLDNDSWQDLVVVNGFISASKERDYWYQMSKIGLATGDVVADAAQWPKIEDRSLSGYERTRVFVNGRRKGGRFREIGEGTGLEDRFDGRAVVLADLFGDGQLDVVVANQKGPLLIYRNESPGDHHWLQVRLRGTKSGTNAFGAEIRIQQGERKQIRVHTAASGFSSQNSPVHHFGLGVDGSPVRAEIRWPSGQRQVFEDLDLDTLHMIEEPK